VRRIVAAILADERGVSLMEYGFIAALVSVAAIAVYPLIGDTLVAIFTDMGDALAAGAAGHGSS